MIVLGAHAPKLLLLGLLVLGAVGIGLYFALNRSAEPRWTVRVFMCAPSDLPGTCGRTWATPAQVETMRAVARSLVADGKVESARFVSSGAALAAMKKQNPDLVKGLTSNPFPPSEEFVVRGRRAAERIASRFHQGRDGVSRVIYSARLEVAR